MEKNENKNKKQKALSGAPSLKDAIFVGACSAGLLVYSLYHHYNDRNVGEWKMSPYLFPTLLSVFGLLLAGSLFADARREAEALSGREDDAPSERKNPIGVLVLVGASVLYYVLLPVIHFIPATILFLLGLFIYLGEWKWWKLLLLSVLATTAVYAIFGVALHVRLP